jgi:hypothetical protein
LQRTKDTIQKEYQLKTNQLQGQLSAKSSEIDELKIQLASVKVDEKSKGQGVGVKSSVDALPKTGAGALDNSQLIDDLRQELETALSERDKLAERIISTEESIERIVAQRIVSEREKIRILEKNIEHLRAKVGDDSNRNNLLDAEKARLQAEVDELSNWKAVYEAGHGMQELARAQKKLNDQNRRLEIAIDSMNSKLGALMDANGIFAQAFDRLKAETGKDPDFMYPEYVLQEDMLSEKARLSAQVKELDEQVSNLETENIRLRKALKNQAGSLGEKSLESIRDSNVDILLENRSSNVIRENKKLKDDIRLLTLQLQNYEKMALPSTLHVAPNETAAAVTLASASGSAAVDNNSKELKSLRDDMQSLLAYIRSKSSATLDDKNIANSITSILLAHNEALMKEIRELQRAQQNVDSDPQNLNQQQRLHLIDADERQGYDLSSFQSRTNSNVLAPPINGSYRLPASSESASSANLPSNQRDSQPSVNLMTSTVKASPNLVPTTAQGAMVLNRNLSQLNLPPEEWAQDVRDLNLQLIECLEQLHEREQELEQHKGMIASFDDHLISVKQQTSVLYHDHMKKSAAWEKREKQYKDDNLRLRHENEDLKSKVNKFLELTEFKRNATDESMDSKLNDLTRKLAVYEVNENILSRKYIALSEQLTSEQNLRQKLELDMAELESTLKKRILYLEQYKVSAGSRLALLQKKLDASVPQGDFLSLQTELEYLREEHLNGLQREVDSRVVALSDQERMQELRYLRLRVIDMETKLAQSNDSMTKLSQQLDYQKDLTNRALHKVKASADLSEMVSEMASYRGEASKMEVELNACRKRNELLLSQLESSANEYDELKTQMLTLECRVDEATSRESASRKEVLELKSLYEDGLVREQAEKLKAKSEGLAKELDDTKRECIRLKEIADISSKQAQTLAFYKEDQLQQLKELQEYCIKLESRGEDDILIGKLQRQLMSTKTSYKVFVRKYQVLQGNMKQRELAIRLLEARLDQREDAMLKLQELHRVDLNALMKALRGVHNTFLFSESSSTTSSSSASLTSKQTLSLSLKLKEVSQRVGHFSHLAENAVTRKHEKELECRKLQEKYQDILLEKEILEQRCVDYDLLLQGKAKQNQVAGRLILMSDEIRASKLSNMQLRRQIQILNQEKKHLESVISTMEANVEDLEEINVRDQVQSLLPDHQPSDSVDFTIDDQLPAIDQAVEKFYQRSSSKLLSFEEDQITRSSQQQKAEKSSDDTNSDLLEQIQSANAQLLEANRMNSANRAIIEDLTSKLSMLQSVNKEREEQIQYYERTLSAEGLPLLNGNRGVATKGRMSKPNSMNEDQERLQEAASATITSLRSLIEDKNRLIDKLRERIEELLQDRSRKKSKADQNADELLDRLQEESLNKNESPDRKDNIGLSTSHHHAGNEDVRIMNQKLLDQLEQADQVIHEKSQTIKQLEEKLLMQINQRERAEMRCGESIKEMENMKVDMLRLAEQLQVSEERIQTLLPKSLQMKAVTNPSSSSSLIATSVANPELEKKARDLMKVIKTKDDKIKGYREIIIKLKEEFIKSEEEKAIALSSKFLVKSDHHSSSSALISNDELKELQQQISTLRGGLQQAKQDLEHARMMREKSNQARQAALNESRQLEEQFHQLQSENALLEEAKRKYQKDLEESKRKEIRMRDKLKDLMEGRSKDGAMSDQQVKIEQLEREVQFLKAQNLALRSSDPVTAAREHQQDIGPNSTTADMTAEAKSIHPVIPGRGHVLGKGSSTGPETKDEFRLQLHEKWEQEKKLQSR